MVAQNFHFEYPLLLLALAIPFLLWWLPRTQLKEDNFDTNIIISKYGFTDDKDKEWIKSIN